MRLKAMRAIDQLVRIDRVHCEAEDSRLTDGRFVEGLDCRC